MKMFNAKKATDMAIHLLKKTGGVDNNNYTKILKLMYLAERESYARYAEPMCGDDMYSLPYGPVLSKTTDFMRGNIHATEWCDMITAQGYCLKLKDPQTRGYKKLSRADKHILDEQWEIHKNRTWQELCEWTHEHCPEWDKSVNMPSTAYKRTPINIPELLRAVGVQNDELNSVIENIEEAHDFNRITSHW